MLVAIIPREGVVAKQMSERQNKEFADSKEGEQEEEELIVPLLFKIEKQSEEEEELERRIIPLEEQLALKVPIATAVLVFVLLKTFIICVSTTKTLQLNKNIERNKLIVQIL